eukprot:TRINITY_DN2391_c0_g1_i7.p1 TRINITY_DN2391_c0_g1~~TRINITY_DN2391_c0_g1_i7.p1  ORF type:complete len:718 (-),score=128.76 TRINITY_DN2391_c0_g1_i7:151-2304(-)
MTHPPPLVTLLFSLVLLLCAQFVHSCSPNVTFTASDRILANGVRVDLKGTSWFGFEGDRFCVEGLDQRPLPDILDFIAQHDFNALRIPFATDIVINANTRYPRNIDYTINPSLRGKTSLQVLDVIFTEASSRGILIMLDMHLFTSGQTKGLQPGLWYSYKCNYDQWGNCASVYPACLLDPDRVCTNYTEQVNKDAWSTLVQRYKRQWNFLGADIQNEPHEPASWGVGGAAYDYAAAAERISNDILTRHPDYAGLIFVEGIGNTPIRPNWSCQNFSGSSPGATQYWWGGNLEAAKCRPLTLSRMNKLVYAPHQYGPSVYKQNYFSSASFPSNMPSVWDRHFGMIRQYTGKPAVMGEWGGASSGQTALWLDAFVSYLISKDMRDNFFWAINPNRNGDTPGLLMDWTLAPDLVKLNLTRTLQPHPTRFMVSGNSICMSSSSTMATMVAATSSTTAQYVITTATTGAPDTSSSGISSTVATAVTTGVSSGPCDVSITQRVSNTWQDGGKAMTQYAVVVENFSPKPITALSLATSSTPTQFWTVTQNTDKTFGLPSHMTNLAPGSQFEWGYVVVGTSVVTVRSPACSSSASTAATSGGAPQQSTVTSASSIVTSTSSTTGVSSGGCPLRITQTQGSSWVQGGRTMISVNVVVQNTSSKSVSSFKVRFAQTPDQIWNVVANSDGSYSCPSYTNIAAGANMQLGYNAYATAPLIVTILSPDNCN